MLVQSVSLVLLAVLTTCVAGQYAMEGKQYSLQCSSGGTVLYWMLHGKGDLYEPGKIYDEKTITVDEDGSLHFQEVMVEQGGNHLCVARDSSGISKGHIVEMKVRPKPPTNLWTDVYRAQFITGLIAALVCAFLFTAGCLVFRFRYREPDNVILISDGGHYNPALEVNEREDYSTRM